MVRLFLKVKGSTDLSKILTTEAKTMSGLHADVEKRLNMPVEQLQLGEAAIKDDHAFKSLEKDDTIIVIPVPAQEADVECEPDISAEEPADVLVCPIQVAQRAEQADGDCDFDVSTPQGSEAENGNAQCKPALLIFSRMRPGIDPTDIEPMLKCVTKFLTADFDAKSDQLEDHLVKLGYSDQLKTQFGTLLRFLQNHPDRFRINHLPSSDSEDVFLVGLPNRKRSAAVLTPNRKKSG